MAKRRTRQRGGNCGLDHQTGGSDESVLGLAGGRRRRKSRRRSRRKRGGRPLDAACTWMPIGSQCDSGLSCQNSKCAPKPVSSSPSAHTMGTIGSMVKFWGGSKRRKSRRRRKRSRGRKSRRKRRTKKRRRKRRKR